MTSQNTQISSSTSTNTKNEIYIKKSSSIRSIVSRGLHVLTEQEFQNTFTVEAQGLNIGKAVTIIEILKRRLNDADLSFWQYNKLDSVNINVSHGTHLVNKEYFLNIKTEQAKDFVVKNIKTKIIPILKIKLSRLPLELTDGWREQKPK